GFATLEEAVQAVERIRADLRRASSAARAVAVECFSHEVVLPPILEAIGLPGRPERAGRVLTPSLVLTPVSRRPPRLAAATAERVLALPPRAGILTTPRREVAATVALATCD